MKTVAFLLSALVAGGTIAKHPSSSPLVSGRLILIHNHEQPVETLLTANQLKALTQWWNQQLPDWTRDYASASSAPGIVELKLKHANDTIDEVAFKSSAIGYFGELRTGRGGCGRWPDESFCHPKETQWQTRSLSGVELRGFWKAAGLKYPPGVRDVFP